MVGGLDFLALLPKCTTIFNCVFELFFNFCMTLKNLVYGHQSPYLSQSSDIENYLLVVFNSAKVIRCSVAPNPLLFNFSNHRE